MPAESRSKPVAAIVATTVSAALMVAAIITYFLVHDGSATAAQPTFSPTEKAAVAAAGTETANLLSYRRAHFQADFTRALNGATGSIKTDIQSKKAATLKAMNAGKFDLSADVLHAALVGKVDDDKVVGYVVLVTLNGYRSTQKNLPTQQNLQVTVVRTNGKWLVSGVRNIAVSS